MKKYIINLLLLILTSSVVIAQKGYNAFYKMYELDKQVGCFKISPGIFKFMMDKESEDYAEHLIHKMREVSFLSVDNPNTKMLSEFTKNTPKRHYKNLMEIKDGESTIVFKAFESGREIHEVLLTVQSDHSLFVMCITGDFDKSDAKKIIKAVDINKAKEQRK